ncbi:MAG: AraC family transcriptional regulator [Gemmatimonadetes bacterium]|nr:AraC family transcriptional regulator [Gemmatimonadota bacterium]
MDRITSLFARKVVAAVAADVDEDALLASVGLEPGAVDPAVMLKDTDYYDFFERAAVADGNPRTFPLRVGASMRCDEYGPFGLAWKSAPTLRDSFDRAERYALVLTSVALYEVEETRGGAFMHLHREGRRTLGMRLSNEATLASIVAISRQVASEPFRPEAVYFKHAAPSSTEDHEAYFESPVHFGSDKDALFVSDGSLRTPNRLGDESIATFFDAHLSEEVDKLDDTIPFERLVRDQISTSLSGGAPALSDVARRMSMSARTLQRRLSKEGHTYQALVEESRRRLATQLLEHTDASLAEISFMTGFSDQSAFTRAFRRWAGQTPRSFRIRAQPD